MLNKNTAKSVLFIGAMILSCKVMAGICIGICIGGGGEIPNGFIYSDSRDGSQTVTYTSHKAAPRAHLPFDLKSDPKRLIFLDRFGNLVGGATQIDKEGLVYATARHVLAGQKELIIKDQDNKSVTFEHFDIFEAKAQDVAPPIDVLLLYFKQDNREKPDADAIVSLLENVVLEPNMNLMWYSWEFSVFDRKTTDGRASGLLVERGNSVSRYFWLDGGQTNYTAPGSSGSVVWQAESSDSTSLHPVGIVQCMEQPTIEERQASSHTPKPRFLSLSYLAKESLIWSEVSPMVLLNGPSQNIEPNCKPIDGRQGGGF